MPTKRSFWPVLAIAIALAVGLSACGPASTPTPEPTPTRPLRPTFTPTPVPTDTPTPTNTPLPTDTPTPLPTDTPTPATPKAKVGGDGQVNVRSGPGTVYPEIGQVATGSELEIVAKSAAGDWYQICCVNNEPVWIVARLVEVTGDANLIQVATNIPAPPTPTRAPTRPPAAPRPTQPPAQPTATPAPAVLFVKYTNEPRIDTNPIVSFFGGLYNKALDLSKPVTGFKMVVQAPSGETKSTDFVSPFLRGDPGIQGSEFLYNAKIEFPLAPGVYRAWVADPGGKQVSEVWEMTVAGETRRFLPRWKQP